jgi:glucuronoarabinoxylan endo-1,4-beta-xylanase
MCRNFWHILSKTKFLDMKKLRIPLFLILVLLVGNICGQNLLINGDFESDFDEWENTVSDSAVATFALETSDAYEGAGAMKLEISTLGTNEWSVQSQHSAWPSVTGTEYKLTLYAKAIVAGTSIRAVQQLDEYDAQDFTLSTEWTKYEWVFIAQENNQQLKFHFYDDGTIYIDNITIEENTNTYPSDNTLNVDTSIHYQTMEGFGGAIAFYQNWVYAHPNKEEFYQLLYDDLGINLLRLQNAYRYETDFSTPDPEFVQKAEEYSDKEFKVLMCSWTPPASLKSNGNENNGTLAKVNGEFVYQDFADYWRDALVAYKAIGVEPDWIGIQNEPDFQSDSWGTCKFTPSETDEFPGYDVALETVNNTISSLDNPPLLLGAEELGIGYNNFNNYSLPIKDAPYLWAYGYHLYHGGDPESPDSYNSSFTNIAQNYNDRPNIMTEYEHFDAGWFKTAWLVSNNISIGNASAYFYWNLIWPGSGLINIDNPWDQANWTNEKGYTVTPHFYAFKHFAKFIDAGYKRISCTNSNDGIRSSVFISPDGSELVMVLLNITDNAISTNIAPAGWENKTSRVFQSVEDNYFQSLGSVPSEGTMELPSQSVTTLVFGGDISVIPVESIGVSPSSLTMLAGNSYQLSVTILPDDATNKNVTWASTNTNILTVDNQGVVTATGEGSASIIVTAEDGALTSICNITVLPANVEKYFSLSLNTIGNGTVSLSPTGEVYMAGTEVTLTAVPMEGYRFDGWGGDVSGSNETIILVMDTNKTVEATFSEIPTGCDSYELMSLPFSKNGSGTYCWEVRGNIDYVNSWGCDEFTINGVDYCGQYSTEILPPDNGIYYISYSSSVSWSYVEIAGTNITGEEYTLTVSSSIGGSVVPDGGSYPAGTEVTLTATPDEGYVFDSWGGDASGESATITLTMDSDKLVSATFTEENDTNVYYSLAVHIEGNGSVAPSGGSYVKGSVVALEAKADTGNEFVSWSGDINGTSTSVSVIMDTNKSVTAMFQVSDGYVCENPEAISVPYSHDGEGEFCLVTSDDIAYVNSWNMEQVEINGADYTNTWSDNLPAKIDGSYYIYYQGLYSWSHLEVTTLKSAKWDDAAGTEISFYPNPYSEKLIILLDKPEFVQGLSIVDQAGRTVYSFSQSEISARIELDKGFEPGVYLLRMVTNNSIKIRQIIHK